MHSFIVSTIDIPNSPDVLVITPETSIGIEEVRKIQNFLSRKPIQLEGNIIILHQAHLLTLPAQHAILKTLEEPPGNAKIYLVTTRSELLLDTILSRVQIVSSDTPTPTLDLSLAENYLSSKNLGVKITFLNQQEFTRESFTDFLTTLEHYIHQNKQHLKLFRSLVQIRKYLQANCNLKILTTHLATLI